MNGSRQSADIGLYVAGQDTQVERDAAEVAVVMQDDWQRQGIGQVLMKQLAEVALQLGIKRFCAVVLATNRGAHALIKGLGYPYQSHVSHGEDEIVIYLEEKPK